MADLARIGTRARIAADQLALCPATVKDHAVRQAADGLRRAEDAILAANAEDVGAAGGTGIAGALIDRLTLSPARIRAMADGMDAVAALPDPVGEAIDSWERPNGLDIRRVRIPLGVVAVIYEARPNVTSDVAALCVKSGNAAILRGSSTTVRSNQAVIDAVVPALVASGLPMHSVQLVTDPGREITRQLMQLGDVDVLVPRGGAGLIADIRENATVPFIIDGDGNCHVYVDASADVEKANRIVINAKTSRPSVCNAAEKLLVHRDIAPRFLPSVCAALADHGVEIRGDDAARRLVPALGTATDDDWPREYLDLTIAIRVVDTLDDAVAHIRRYSTGHTEAIITEEMDAAQRFVRSCPSAVVMVNASTRFTDGGEFGFGAEIGNSTQKLHARGPMGLRELTTYRIEVWGDGQVRD